MQLQQGVMHSKLTMPTLIKCQLNRYSCTVYTNPLRHVKNRGYSVSLSGKPGLTCRAASAQTLAASTNLGQLSLGSHTLLQRAQTDGRVGTENNARANLLLYLPLAAGLGVEAAAFLVAGGGVAG